MKKIVNITWDNLFIFFSVKLLHQRTLGDKEVGVASFHLDGDAQLWFLKMEHDIVNITWEEFKQYNNLHFGLCIHTTKLGELSNLQQIGSVEDFQHRSEQLAPQAGCLTANREMHIFWSGLDNYVAIEVEYRIHLTSVVL